jgi:hypothetical protein
MERFAETFDTISRNRSQCGDSANHAWIDEDVDFVDEPEIEQPSQCYPPSFDEDVRHAPAS